MDEVGKKFGVLDSVPMGVCILREDFVILFWNSCLEGWTGLERNKVLGTKITSHFPHLNDPKYSNRLSGIFAGGPPTIFSSQLHKRIIPSPLSDGKLRIQHTTVTPVRALDGEGFYALLSIQDVTDLTYRIQAYRSLRDHALEEIKERKRTEMDLQQAHVGLELRVKDRTADLIELNEKLQQEIAVRRMTEEELKNLISTLNALVDHIPEGIALLDGEHRIILANDIGKNYLNTIAGVRIGDILPDISGQPIEQFLVSSSHTIWHEVTVYTPQKVVFELAGRAIEQKEVMSGMVLVLKDVTEERIFEERIHSQERLAAVGQLAAGIAHDFNNILTGIIGLADILLTDSALNVEDRNMVNAILQNGQRAAQLIRQILDFSRKSISEMKTMDLLPFLREFSKFIRRTIPENIEITIEAGSGEFLVCADPAKIQQVLANLTVNAQDAMPGGGVLKFSLALLTIKPGEIPPIHEMAEGDWIVLTVADTGTGITSEILTHIFEPFFTTKDVSKGTGLGLSQVYGIVKQHEGHIAVETKAGKGCIFNIYLPAGQPREDTPVARREVAYPQVQDTTVLVVEDNEAVRSLVERKLTRQGYKVLTATNGEKALKLFDEMKDEIKLVITDLVMPVMGGVELGRMLKQKNPGIKIIGLSGYPLGLEKDDLRDAGIVECLQKPFKGQALVEALHRTLDGSSD